jgi:uncharacterized membrane protein (DUF2068 family)
MIVTPTKKVRNALRAIALFEALKGVAAIAAGAGLLSLAHQDLRAIAYALIGHFHLNPDAHYPKLFLDEATWLASADIRQIVFLAIAYAAIRLTECYGLWRDRAWAEWLAALSGGIYLPLEIEHVLAHTTLINLAVLTCNIAVVGYMTLRLRARKMTKDQTLS